ncbi:UDP-N-acetylbacillosamine N-acetyltransferase [Campylobacter fetus]|uniref:UDP-N-acetylbacillosamine N-acetyltransferase n=1 Tax=Campylobacter fetus TaxID=196 RepID=UPI000FCC40FC|nr:UDP-N-acetylbacillosamine N-acetyltransferase [Campylobacter fetus]QQF52133.1 UDP-N-acetylbacillosamine N-acetyltransferase [Campylobacter fetus subsp. venerealis]RUT50562.1 acetyltransferase [Campylobacter fetus]RUT50879.1 acetyltransferase [Campylobacter fetus]
MKKIYIYGHSGHGKVVSEIAKLNGYGEIIFLDDASEFKFKKELPKHDIIIAIGNARIRHKLQTMVLQNGFNVVNLIHPNAAISQSAKFGKGIVVMANAVVNANVILEDGVIINSGAIIDHDCFIGEFAHICPGVSLAGNVSVGKFSWIGIGSCAIQGVKIKNDIMIGAGSVIVKDILIGDKAYGNPCKVVPK